jgi:hypothetical protein
MAPFEVQDLTGVQRRVPLILIKPRDTPSRHPQASPT